MSPRHLLVFLVSLTINLTLHANETIALFASPNAEWPPVEIADARSTQLKLAKPFDSEDPQTANWFKAEYRSRYTGYALAKDLQTKKAQSFPVYLEKNTDSPILIELDRNEPSRRVHEGNWVEITFKKQIPLYFQKDSARANAHTNNTSDADKLARQFEGTLKLHPKTLGLPSRYQYELKDGNNRRIGFVTTETLIENLPLSHYINQYVIIQGTPKPSNQGHTLVIQAKTIQLKKG